MVTITIEWNGEIETRKLSIGSAEKVAAMAKELEELELMVQGVANDCL